MEGNSQGETNKFKRAGGRASGQVGGSCPAPTSSDALLRQHGMNSARAMRALILS